MFQFRDVVDAESGAQSPVPAAERAGSVEAKDVPGHDAVHQERQADGIAGCDEVWAAMDVDGDVVGALGEEVGEV